MRSLLSARLHIIEKDGSRRKPRAGSNDSGLRDLDRKYRAWKFRRALLRWLAPIAIVAAAGSARFYAKLEASGWRAGELIAHIAAYNNCDAARAAGVAPARRGEPGYYARHDRDNDGIACEVWPRR